ncbi:hypothetical protein [Methylovirgula sp. 4M-Z18]|uniref:hypothetical protein n=1 Tax=Methylovirgula sp. 4M-Z18 TaxID=2293567 RepID=UPI000E2E7A68|nr:hypothetical protein [Methylovirgula sp. 4M-Z18]RFB80013.1 hypothetical protein DYH55_00220 [Methylovirgula sp. 4M-Z18]
MGVCYDLILIKPAPKSESPEALRDLLGDSAAVHSYPAKFQRFCCDLWIGEIENCMVLDSYNALQMIPFADNPEAAIAENVTIETPELVERILLRFPDSEIAALTLDSRVGAYGYSVFRSGKMIRSRFGLSGVLERDYGEKLPFETNYLSSNYEAIENNGVISYKSIASPTDDELSGADLGEDLAIELFRVFTGSEPDSAEMGKIVGTGFTKEPIEFDPQDLLEYPTLSQRLSDDFPTRRQSFSWKSYSLALGALLLVWLFLMATR